MRTLARAALVVAFFALLPSCRTPLVQPAESWVRADRALYDQLAPTFRQYVEADAGISPLIRDGRLGLLKDWEFRLRTNEEFLGLSEPGGGQ